MDLFTWTLIMGPLSFISFIMVPLQIETRVKRVSHRAVRYAMPFATTIHVMCKCFQFCILLNFAVGASAMPNPNVQRDQDFLPGVTRWNGIPFQDFSRCTRPDEANAVKPHISPALQPQASDSIAAVGKGLGRRLEGSHL